MRYSVILSRYVLRETAKTQVGLFAILTGIFLCQSYIQILSRATKGDIPGALVSQLLVLSIPNMSVLMLPLTVFLAVLISLGRFGGDSETIVMRSFGVPPSMQLKCSMVLAFVTAAVALVNAMWFVPMAQQKQEALMSDAKENASYFALESGKFVTLGRDRSIVVYIDEIESNDKKTAKATGRLRELKGVYVFTSPSDKMSKSATSAKSGYVTRDEDGVMWFVIEDGTTYAGPDKNGQFSEVKFDEYRFWVSEKNGSDAVQKVASVPTSDLIGSDLLPYKTEFQWRVNAALSILVLVLIVVPLSGVMPRQGSRFSKFLPALLVYGSYFLFLAALRNLVDRGVFPLYPGLYAVPVAYFLFLAIPVNLTETRWYKKRQLKSYWKRTVTK